MFCSNCGNSIQDGSSFCSKCGKKINNGNDLPLNTASETTHQEISITEKKVDSIPELKNYLSGLKDKEGETALAYALNAQLQVLEVVQSSSLSMSMFDVMLESLNTALERTENDSQKKLIQQKAAIMINSMFFFMEAKIIFKKEKRKEDGLQLLSKACNMLADSAPAIANLAITKGMSILVDGKKIFENISKDRSIIDQVIYFVSGGGKIEEMEIAFLEFKFSVLDKLSVYRHLFGRSILLAELVDRVGPEYIDNELGKMGELSDKVSIVLLPIAIILILLLVLGVMALIDLKQTVNLANAKHWIWTIIKFGSLTIPATVIIIVSWWGIKKRSFERHIQKLSHYFRYVK